jgi:hypothetical protein
MDREEIDFIDHNCTQQALYHVWLSILKLIFLISETRGFGEFSRPKFLVRSLPTSFKMHLVAFLERCVGQARSPLCDKASHICRCEMVTVGLTRWGWCTPVDYRWLDYAACLVQLYQRQEGKGNSKLPFVLATSLNLNVRYQARVQFSYFVTRQQHNVHCSQSRLAAQPPAGVSLSLVLHVVTGTTSESCMTSW